MEAVFTVDANGQIVLAVKDSMMPDVSSYTPVLQSTSAKKIKDNHPGIKLYLLGEEVIKKAQYGSLEYMKLLLTEGVSENLEDLMNSAIR